MSVVTGDRYLEKLVAFVDHQAEKLIDCTVLLKLNPAGLHYVHSRLEALRELENLLSGAPIDYLRAYVSDLGDYRALEQLRRILRLLTSVKVVSVLPPPVRDPTPISLLPFGRLKVLELRGCDLSTSAGKGLLELRHTLEKLICHNSTDALRHIFAPRIADVRYCPQWNRLSFISCAFNRLVLMDESLQLLPAVETLDLSRNKFAKVDNLRKCTKLKYLDLGFNHLRTIALFSEVSCNIVKLVLRNNALASLHGLENLKTLEGLDVSYNILSNFSELEFLAGLPFLQDLWLEGNPLCCARWYRAQVFTYFSHPDKLKLDGKEISTRDFWKRQIILASRQKQPANFGFYFPAKEDVEGDGSISKKRRKVSRLASIETEEESTCFSSDVESQSCDNEIQSKEENAVSDEETEIVDLINRVETMKKERSVLWLREFKEWMNHEAEKFAGGGACGTSILQPMRKDHVNNGTNIKNHGESSSYVVDSLQISGDESSTHVIESETSFVDANTESNGMAALLGSRKMILGHNHQKSHSTEDLNGVPLLAKNSHSDSLSSHKGHRVVENGTRSPLTAVDDTTESHSSSACPGSPPHYQRDILSRRHNLVEEILQLSAESYSIASSDSDTSSSGEEQGGFGSSYELDPSRNEEYLYSRVRGLFYSNICRDNYDEGHSIHATSDNQEFLFHSSAEQTSSNVKVLNSNSKDFPSVSHELEIVDSFNQEADQQEKRKSKRKLRRRVVAISENAEAKKDKTENSNGDGQCKRNVFGSDVHEFIDKEQSRTPAFANTTGFSDDFIERYFNSNIADSSNNEVCRCYLHCDCILEPGSLYREREVALLLSSEKKLYVMLVGVAFEGSGSIVSLLACHRVEDVKEISVGIGLQFVRVYIEKGATYLFLTRNIEKSRQLLSTFQLFGPFSANDECSLISLEQVQVELFRKQICGGSKLSIFQYSMLLFSSRNNEDESWVLRSMFVSGGYVFVCVEDLKQFGSLSVDGSSHPYFSLDSCCSISDISELVVMAKEGKCSLAFKEDTAKLSLLSKTKAIAVPDKGNKTSGCLRWKLKWFSEESLLNFVALLKAIHAGATSSSLPVTFTS